MPDDFTLTDAQEMLDAGLDRNGLDRVQGATALLLNDLAGSSTGGFRIPEFDYQAFTYVAAGAADDDDVATIVFKSGGAAGTTVATLTFAYVGATNNVASITQS